MTNSTEGVADASGGSPIGAPPVAHIGDVSEYSANDASLADYSSTVGVVGQLVDVRFKLVAFIPALTGAAVALLAASRAAPLQQAVLGVGGLVFALGVVLYDQRNSQHYNGAIGRAEFLEEVMRFPRGRGDEHGGVYGSRRDTTSAMEKQRKNSLLGLPVRHGPALALVYTATLAAWVWSICDAAADGLMGLRSRNWIAGNGALRWIVDHGNWLAVGLTLAAAVVILREFCRLDPWRDKKPPRQSGC